MPTIEQAKGMWCPMVRHEGDVGGPFSTGHRDLDPINAANTTNGFGCNCIGDRCMMWRWSAPSARSFDPKHTANGKPPTRQGHCGLAGRPEFAP